MEKDKRQGWLKELKVGDEVFVEYIGNSDNYNETMFGTVSRITPTGRISVFRITSNEMKTSETQYSAEGYNRNGLFPTRLVNVIPELKERLRESYIRNITTTINNTTLHNLKLNNLELLIDYLEIFKKTVQTMIERGLIDEEQFNEIMNEED
jgi:hypothetical protein